MSSKVKRKVTVENKDNGDQQRRPSVFERLGPGAVSVAATQQQQERHNRNDPQGKWGKCKNWLRCGECPYGSSCRFQHDPFATSTSRRSKSEKEIPEKDLRHKVRNKREDNKAARSNSVSPKRKGSKRSGSRSRKGEHESKIKSTVVVSRPRSPAAKSTTEPQDREKKKADGTWEEDMEDWPTDSAQLDYKEELTLERKRQQLQRELELEYQKERMLNESVTITKTVSFSESSSSSSSSESGSLSTTSDSSSSSSDDDSDDSSSSSSSSSSSASRPPKKKTKKLHSAKETEIPVDSGSHKKTRDDYDKIKSSRAAKIGIPNRSPIPSPEPKLGKKGNNRRAITPSPLPSPKHSRFPQESTGSGRMKSRVKGPHTPSPPHSRRQRQWEQSSSADSRSADARHGHGKRHKRKKDPIRNEANKSDRPLTPPPQLSSPNRTALLPNAKFVKKSRLKIDELMPKSRHRNRESPPLLLSRMSSGHSNSPAAKGPVNHGRRSLEHDRSAEPQIDRSKMPPRKYPEDTSRGKRSGSRELPKRSKFSPRRDNYREPISSPRGKMDGDGFLGSTSRKSYPSPVTHIDKGDDRRRRSPSPVRGSKDPRDRRSFPGEFDKKRELRDSPPRSNRDNQNRGADVRNYPRKDNETISKRPMSPDMKKGKDDKGRDRPSRDRNIDHEPIAWSDDLKKPPRSDASRTADGRGWQDMQPLPPSARNERPRDKERDRKKGKEREMSHRSIDEGDKQRLTSPIRGRSPLRGRLALPDVDAPMITQRSRLYEPDLPPGDRDYGYEYDVHRDPLFAKDRLLPPEYEADFIRGPPGYGSDSFSEGGRYRKAPPLKDQRGGDFSSSSRDLLQPREIDRRNDDYMTDMPMDDRHSYDERWGRNRPLRDEWDQYSGLPPSHPPPPSLDEDRYGMPRRRRASPDWPLRNDDRPMSPANHRHPPPLPPPNQRLDPRGSRSPPPKGLRDSSRGSWGEHPGRHSSKGSDNRHDLQQKNQEERKGRSGKRDHQDRINRRRDAVPASDNKPPLSKDKPSKKRTRSPSPIPKESKKRKEDIPHLDSALACEKSLSKRSRDESKIERRPPGASIAIKTVKADPPSPKGSTNSKSSVSDKVEASQKSLSGSAKSSSKPEKEEKKRRPASSHPIPKELINAEDLLLRYGMLIRSSPEPIQPEISKPPQEKSQVDDDFSDWSDGDDELLNQDDFNEVNLKDDLEKSKTRGEEPRSRPRRDGNTVESTKLADAHLGQPSDQLESAKAKHKEPLTQSISAGENKDRVTEDTLSSCKEKETSQELKEYEAIDSFMVKDETDTDDYITSECVDYDPISDDELEALIEEPDDQAIMKQDEKNENSGIVDALDVDWSTLMSKNETKSEFVPGFARKRFKTAHVLSRIGFSQMLAGTQLTEKIYKFCQEQIDKEMAEGSSSSVDGSMENKKFTMEHQVAAFHVAISASKKERTSAFSHLGPNRRALCARKDLQIRKLLCQPLNKLVDQAPATYRQQPNVDKELYKKSLELLNLKKAEYQPQTVDVY